MERKNRFKVVFLSSSFVNIAKLFALENKDADVFLILDRNFPFEIEDLDNFYPYIFNKGKIFEKNKEKYFDMLAVFIQQFEPDFIITTNFSKLLPSSFIEFFNFTSSKTKLLNIHHGDLRVRDNTSRSMLYSGLRSDIKEMLNEEKIITTLHLIEDEGMDTGKQLSYSYETTLKELKQKGLIHKKEDILNLRIRNVILSYHERTKVLKLLRKVIDGFA